MKKMVLLFAVLLAFSDCNGKTNSKQTENNTAAVEQNDDNSGAQEKYKEFSLPGIGGGIVNVADYVKANEYTLIDFWASWCGPCMAEMPVLKQAYKNFKSKGFEIVGVSLDNDENSWKTAIEQLNLKWPQMSDLKGWECAAAQLYGVRSIPSNVLVDKNGVIVAANLRGEDLLNTLASIFK